MTIYDKMALHFVYNLTDVLYSIEAIKWKYFCTLQILFLVTKPQKNHDYDLIIIFTTNINKICNCLFHEYWTININIFSKRTVQ